MPTIDVDDYALLPQRTLCKICNGFNPFCWNLSHSQDHLSFRLASIFIDIQMGVENSTNSQLHLCLDYF